MSDAIRGKGGEEEKGNKAKPIAIRYGKGDGDNALGLWGP